MAPELIAPHRVALYAAPAPGTEWWERGSEWLGRCAFRGVTLAQPAVTGLTAEPMAALTADPRRYGWHATLKAPWRLASGLDLGALRERVGDVCGKHRTIERLDLQVTRLGNFLALCPSQPPVELAALAADCVRRLQHLAAPLTDAELAHRRRQPLSAEEEELLRAWGYPWVLHRFRFHFSLTGSISGLPESDVGALMRAAQAHFTGLPPLTLDRLSIFIEASAGADFSLLEQLPLRP